MILQPQIEQAIRDHFQIVFFELLNESHMHVGPATESHFKLILVSEDFNEMNKVNRQKAVYKVLAALMPKFHALALHTYAPEEWELIKQAPASPLCSGGH